MWSTIGCPMLIFYPRSPCGERLGTVAEAVFVYYFSIHALLAESDLMRLFSLSTPINLFYPRSPCGERPYVIRHAVNLQAFSIHALLAESDRKSAQNSGALLRI